MEESGLIIKCDRCGLSLNRPGALVFGPPMNCAGWENYSMKRHLCFKCFEGLLVWLNWEGKLPGEG